MTDIKLQTQAQTQTRSQPVPHVNPTHLLQQNVRNQISSLSSLSALKSAQELSQQLSSALKLQYFRTMEVMYRTHGYQVAICMSMCGKMENENKYGNNRDRNMEGNHNNQSERYQRQENIMHQARTNQQQSPNQQPQIIYMPEAMLIGNITNIQRIQIRGSPQLMRAIFKSSYDNSQKHILILCQFYKTNLIRFFNNMMRPQNKNNKYAFTHLKPIIYLNNQIPVSTSKLSTTSSSFSSNNFNNFNNNINNPLLSNPRQLLFFLLQPQTQLITLTQPYYLSQLKPIQRILTQDSYFNYSNIKLTKIFTIDQLDYQCRDGFQIKVIKQKLQNREKKDSVIIVGLVTQIQRVAQDKNFRHRKQIVLWMVQVLFKYPLNQHKYTNQQQHSSSHSSSSPTPTPIPQLGRCRIILRYSSSDQHYIQNLFKINNIYAIADPQLVITDNVNVIYMVNISKNNIRNCCIFRVNQEGVEGVNFGQNSFYHNSSNSKKRNAFQIQSVEKLFGIKLHTGKISNFWQKCINRNIVKLQIGLLQVQLLYGSIRCSKCPYQIKHIPEQQQKIMDQNLKNIKNMQQRQEDQDTRMFECRIKHKQYHCLQLWGTVRVADQSGSCLVSMEHKEIIRFLELEQYYEEIQTYVKKNGRGLVIISSNKQKLKPNQDPLLRIKNNIRKTYVEKTIICHAKFELDKTFRESLNEEQQLQYQSSFQNTKKYLQNNKKIFPNGIIQGRGEETVLVPFVKALQICDSQ